MHYLDPSRPRLHDTEGLPLLDVPQRVVIPGLHIAPRGTPDNAQMEVSVFLPSGTGSTRKAILLTIDEFPVFWAKWLADPEATARELFNWTYTPPIAKSAAKAPSSSDFSLEDLLADL